MTNERLPINRLPNNAAIANSGTPERFSDEEMEQIKRDFANRLYEAFNAEKPTQIAQALQVPDATISYYVKALRLPVAEMLIQIHKKTGISLNWLLLGKGRKYIEYEQGFSSEELAEIEAMAKKSGRTFQDELRALVLAGKEAVKKYQG